MIKRITTLTLAVLMFALGSCSDDKKKSTNDAGTDSGTDTDTSGMVELSGVCIDDTFATVAPVQDATISVDTGVGEPLVTQSDADGTFSILVPEDTPVTVTAAAADRWALTYAGIIPANEPSPLAFWMIYRDMAMYSPQPVTVGGNINGAPEDSVVSVYGSEQEGNYNATIDSTDPIPFSFNAKIWTDEDTLTYTAIAFDPADYTMLDVTVFDVDLNSPDTTEITFTGDPLSSIEITSNRPVLDDTLLPNVDQNYGHLAGTTYLGETYQDVHGTMAITGFSSVTTVDDDTITVTVPFKPIAGFTNVVRNIFSEDLTDPGEPMTIAMTALESGDTTLNVDVLDSPVVADKITFEPGATLTWDTVEGATDYQLLAITGNVPAWWIITRNPEVTFPKFPTDFDESLINLGGGWMARGRDFSGYTWSDTELVFVNDIRVSSTSGGQTSW